MKLSLASLGALNAVDSEMDYDPYMSSSPTPPTLSTSAQMPTLNTAPKPTPIVQPPDAAIINPSMPSIPAVPGPKNTSDWARSLSLFPKLQSTLGMNNLMLSIAGGLSAVLITSLLLGGSSYRRGRK
jgi:hypothetical protein